MGNEAQVPLEGPPITSSEAMAKRLALEQIRLLKEKNNPSQPFITSFGEGEDETVIINRPITLPGEGSKDVRIMITTKGVLLLEHQTNLDYVKKVSEARKKGWPVEISPVMKEKDHVFITIKPPSGTPYVQQVKIIDSNFQEVDTIKEAISEGYKEANDKYRPQIELFTDLNAFTKTLGENPADSSLPPAPPSGPQIPTS